MDLFEWSDWNKKERRGKLERAFEDFHKDNPHIYDWCVKFARQLHFRHAHGSINLVFERVRWEVHVTTTGDEAFKLNNNHRAFYARLIESKEPDLKGFFRLRQQRIQCSFGPPNSELPPGEHIA